MVEDGREGLDKIRSDRTGQDRIDEKGDGVF